MDWLQLAGWMAWPLGACALAAVGLFLERWNALSSRRVLPKAWRAQMIETLQSGQSPKDLDRVAAGRMVAALGAADARRRARVQDVGQRLVAEMERGVSWLGTIAALAPLLGLTGTVLGMIKVFQRITEMGGGDAQALAGGIWMALLTTVIGLLVAMPTLVLHRLLQGRVTARIGELELFGDALIEAAGE
jgi:biopolymer transport protein ExbB